MSREQSYIDIQKIHHGKFHGNEILDPDKKCEHLVQGFWQGITEDYHPTVCVRCLKYKLVHIDDWGIGNFKNTDELTKLRKATEKKLIDKGFKLAGNSGLWERTKVEAE